MPRLMFLKKSVNIYLVVRFLEKGYTFSMKFSKRTDWPLVQNRLTRILEAKKAAGVSIIDLTESNPTRCEFKYLDSALLKPLSDPKNLVYEPASRGLLEARKSVCGYYAEKGIRLHADQIFLTAGTSEAYSLLLRLLCDVDDQILAPKPSYPLLDYLSDLNDVKLSFYDLRYQNSWRMEKAAFSKVSQKTRAIVVINPNNPTGNFVTDVEKAFVSELARKNGGALIADEVFFDFAWEETAGRTSFAGGTEVLSFTLGGISKLMGLPQMKLGWIVVNGPRQEKEEAIQRLEVISDTYLSVGAPVQNAFPGWLQNYRRISQEIRQRCLENLGILRQASERCAAIRVLESEGGWYGVLALNGTLSDEALAVRLLEAYNVLVHPGYFFNFETGKEIVLSLLVPSGHFGEGIERLVKLF